MAKKVVTTTEFIDDLDGGAAADTVSFAYDGTNFEIDLSKKNKTAMDKAFKLYIEHARKVRTTTRRAGAAKPAARRDLSAVRAWAKEQGFAVSDRGRIAAEIIQAYDAAH